ncbi:hypothetical protein CEXT_718531 [Caerostris extrusa]|uniref:Uncharacterized protein n=1 Tax=Caerostris extrusa TaxID=172846 RepID=A0AAV4USW0_CAEEX|nr:hypothetical protein CEXT_718531 [Caerostris extrusa]
MFAAVQARLDKKPSHYHEKAAAFFEAEAVDRNLRRFAHSCDTIFMTLMTAYFHCVGNFYAVVFQRLNIADQATTPLDELAPIPEQQVHMEDMLRSLHERKRKKEGIQRRSSWTTTAIEPWKRS